MEAHRQLIDLTFKGFDKYGRALFWKNSGPTYLRQQSRCDDKNMAKWERDIPEGAMAALE